ncbi:phosphatase PAP2 family protein [Delftia lacustris]|uniref:phosphatase PAP2 family protein n=1 Tax=Delftia lacustris TaxID=558537 RepID=UPI0035A730C9
MLYLEKYGAIFATLLTLFVAFFLNEVGEVNGVYDFSAAFGLIKEDLLQPMALPLMVVICFLPILFSKGRVFSENTVGVHQRAFLYAAIFISVIGFPFDVLDIVSLVFLVYLAAVKKDRPIALVTSVGLFLILFVAVGYLFTVIKANSFVETEFFDQSIFALDEYLFGLPHRKVAALVASQPGLQKFLSDFYLLIHPIIFGQLISCALFSESASYQRYKISLFTLYTLGAGSYFVFPAWGPYAYDFGFFNGLGWFDVNHPIVGIQKFIFNNSQKIANSDYDFSRISPYAFVAAMPSFHLALPAIYCLCNIKNPRLLVPGILIAAVTTVATLATGMHYFLDLIAGVLLSLISVGVARVFIGLINKKTTSSAAAVSA